MYILKKKHKYNITKVNFYGVRDHQLVFTKDYFPGLP